MSKRRIPIENEQAETGRENFPVRTRKPKREWKPLNENEQAKTGRENFPVRTRKPKREWKPLNENEQAKTGRERSQRK